MEKLTNKRESGISRIVGVEESVERELLDYFKRQFEKEHTESDAERGCPPELIGLVSEINEKMKEFMARYGLQFLEIPSRNIHVIDKSKLNPQQLMQINERYEKTNGLYLPRIQQIAILLENYSANEKLRFVQILIHEMIHANAFTSVQKVKEGGLQLTKNDQVVNLGSRRTGFEINSIKTGKRLFYEINEAITTELAIRFDRNYFSQFPDLKQEYEEREKEIEGVAKRSGKKKDEILISRLEHRPKDKKGGHEVVLRTYSYHEERERLKKLISDLWEKNKNEFKSPEDVFTLFAKAALSGRILPIARLIEKTYGKGSFKKIGGKTATDIKTQ